MVLEVTSACNVMGVEASLHRSRDRFLTFGGVLQEIVLLEVLDALLRVHVELLSADQELLLLLVGFAATRVGVQLREV